jgi:chorismate synthase
MTNGHAAGGARGDEADRDAVARDAEREFERRCRRSERLRAVGCVCGAAASVVMENVVAFEIARAFLEKFGGDSMHEVQAVFIIGT